MIGEIADVDRLGLISPTGFGNSPATAGFVNRLINGKNGLYALADWHASRSPYHFNWCASYLKVMDLLFAQLKMEERNEFSRVVNCHRIEEFLRA